MRAIIALLIGLAAGIAAGVALLLWNPIFDSEKTSRLSGINFKLPVAGEGARVITRSANGYPWLSERPTFAPKPNIQGMHSAMTVMQVGTGAQDTSAFVVRLQALSDDGRPLFGELIEESLFYVVLPEAGSLVVSSRDDLWGFARQLSLPLFRGAQWRGDLKYRSTIGPERGYAEARGVTGMLQGVSGRAELMQSVRAVSLANGITDGDSTISVALDLPEPEAAAETVSQTP